MFCLQLNRSTFVEELKPWVVTKIEEERECERLKQEVIESQSYGLYSQQDEESGYSDEKLLDNVKESEDISASEFGSNLEIPSPIQPDLLMNSALNAAQGINQVESPVEWYQDNPGSPKRTQSNFSRLSYTRDISRSETSLLQEASSTSSSTAGSLKDIHSDTTLESFPTGFSHHTHHHHLHKSPKKGHSRSKSDQIGVLKDEIDGFGLTLPSSSLPKQFGHMGLFIYIFDISVLTSYYKNF